MYFLKSRRAADSFAEVSQFCPGIQLESPAGAGLDHKNYYNRLQYDTMDLELFSVQLSN